MTRSKLAVLAFGAFLMTACQQAATGPEVPSVDDRPPVSPPMATIRVVNRASEPIFFVYLSDCSDPNWGADRLGASEILVVGRSRDFQVAAGCYDARVETASGRFAEYYGLDARGGVVTSLTITGSSLIAGLVTAPREQGSKMVPQGGPGAKTR